jgi:hypothetical protein
MTTHTILFAIPPRKLNKSISVKIAGSLGKPSKMPGRSYGISAKLCKVGSALAKVAGSTCHGCYALKANYSYPSVQKAHQRRVESLGSVSWADAMIYQIKAAKDQYFRWHDAGDLQSFQHLLDIVRIAEALPDVNFWLPTREKSLVNQYTKAFGAFPSNLVVRVSAAMVDGKAPVGYAHTSTVHENNDAIGFECKAYLNKNKCGDCRACWSADVSNVSYRKH